MDSLEQCLSALAEKYVWWETPAQAMEFPHRVMAQVMDVGTFDDVRGLVEAAGEETLRLVVARAEPGWFTGRSWSYWHYRLHLAVPDEVPPLPVRKAA